MQQVGIRREDMYAWERRTPLIPSDARRLVDRQGLDILVQTSSKRAFREVEYEEVGIGTADTLASCPIIVGIKEVPVPVLEPKKVYVFFSHTIKGQPYNMPMLQRLLDLGCTLIDYEKVTDESGRRLIYFGNYAGLAGMIETLWAFGQRLAHEGIVNPFAGLERPLDYPDLETAKAALAEVGARIAETGIPSEVSPLIVGLAGYGNVSQGAQEILDLLPVRELAPDDVPGFVHREDASLPVIHKVVFKEEHLVEPVDPARTFELQDYYDHPERYRGVFERYLPHLGILVNCLYWTPAYPRLLTKGQARNLYGGDQPRLRVIGDISCDVEGAIECTVKATEPGNPVYVYDSVSDRATDGVAGAGPVIMAVEILPTELPREASAFFSGILKTYLPQIAAADYDGDFTACDLPPELKRAVIAYRGVLTSDYRYMARFVSENAGI